VAEGHARAGVNLHSLTDDPPRKIVGDLLDVRAPAQLPVSVCSRVRRAEAIAVQKKR
jgi:hypothetical protein